MSGHTPGPWTAHHGFANGGPFDGHPNWCEVVSEFDGAFNRFSCSGHFGMANARLIAAAPELLAALEKAIEHCIWPSSGISAAEAEARAAIAKATGEQA